MRNITKIVIHHSAGRRDDPIDSIVSSISRAHKARLHPNVNGFGNHVAYHAIGNGRGEEELTRPEDEIGYHAGVWNVNVHSLAYCMAGNFHEGDTEPTEKQLVNMKTRVRYWCEKYGLDKHDVFLHRSLKPTACPGKNIDYEWLIDYIFTDEIPDWAQEAIDKATASGVLEKPHDLNDPIDPVTLEWLFYKAGVLKNEPSNAGLTKMRAIVMMDRLRKIKDGEKSLLD